MSGILTMQDGFPFTVQCGPGNIQNGGGICYPDATGVDWRLSGSERSRTRWFNTDAFVDRNPAGGPFRYGTVARNSLIGPGFVSLDASASKRFMFGEQHLEFRVEVFNVPNLPIWGNRATSFERRTSASSTARGSIHGRFSSGSSSFSDHW